MCSCIRYSLYHVSYNVSQCIYRFYCALLFSRVPLCRCLVFLYWWCQQATHGSNNVILMCQELCGSDSHRWEYSVLYGRSTWWKFPLCAHSRAPRRKLVQNGRATRSHLTAQLQLHS